MPLMDEMNAWCMRGYPNEACGLVVETAGSLSVLCLENLQDRLHALDPERYPRTAATAYNLDPRAFQRVEDAGGVVRAIFHSHPDRGAYFSDEDILSALGGDPDGDPILTGVDYLVISARSDGCDDAKLYTWTITSRSFEEV
jgi:proteasome lid subunit RPN8/RPN11